MHDQDHFDPNKPIFQEPPEDDGENWSAFLIGGMAVTDEFGLARSYKTAADALVEKALAASDLSYEFAYPVLYLYRHVIELYLKLIVRPTKLSHGLHDLIEKFDEIVRTKLKQAIPEWVKNRLTEFADVDPDAQAFRFATDRKGHQNLISSGEWWIEFEHLRRTVDLLAGGFERAHFALNKR